VSVAALKNDAPSFASGRSLAFVAALALVWITPQPFADLGAADALDLATGRDALIYIAYALCAGLCLSFVYSSDQPALKRLATPSLICLSLWVGASCLLSQDPSTSFKRAALCGCVAVVAAAAPLLPRGRRQFAVLLTISVGALLTLSYLGVIFAPRYAIHQASDLAEPELAGDWRGVFDHKNAAGAVFVLTAFIGLFVARVWSLSLGAGFALLSLVFVLFAHGKTATMLWAPTLVISLFVGAYGAGWVWRCLALGPFVALNALGVGSALSPSIAAFAARLPIDATFTGRTDIWRYALTKLAERPLTGFGFDAFWNTAAVRYGADTDASWVAEAAHAHNGFVDIAMSMGAPGVALSLWAFVLQPLVDIRAALRRGADVATLTLLTQIWLFCLYTSSMESFLFNRSDPSWIMFLFAIFSLKYLSAFRLSP
jgi:O-antigen ligase